MIKNLSQMTKHKTKILEIKLTDHDYQNKILEASAVLKRGDIIGLPTETVYGLASNGLDPISIDKIFKAKQRPQDNPLILHISSLSMLQQYFPSMPPIYTPLIRKFWPGSLTILLPKPEIVPDIVTAGHPVVAVRMPSHDIARSIIEATGVPLAAPSANLSGKPSPTTALHVWNDLKGLIPLIVESDQCQIGLESTIVDGISYPNPVVLRPGGITLEDIKTVKGFENTISFVADKHNSDLVQNPTTPGMKYRHYSPDAKLILLTPKAQLDHQFKFIQNSQSEIMVILDQDHGQCGVILTLNNEEKFINRLKSQAQISNLYSPLDELSVSKGLFYSLRMFDDMGLDLIIVQGVPNNNIGLAIMNRLHKAASKVIYI